VSITIGTVLKNPIELCFNPGVGAYGEDLESVCEDGLYVKWTNSSGNADFEMKFTRKSFSAFSSTKRTAGRFQAARSVLADDDAQTVNLAPGTTYVVTAVSPKSDHTDMIQLNMTGSTCGQNRMGPGCPQVSPLEFDDGDALDDDAQVQTGNFSVAAPKNGLVYTYYSVDTQESWGAVTFYVTQVDEEADEDNVVDVFASPSAPPTEDVNADVDTDTDGDTQIITIYNPYPSTWYLGLKNNGESAHTVNITQVTYVCDTKSFGFNCSLLVKENITEVSATELEPLEMDAPEDDEDMHFFKVTNTHSGLVESANGTFIRVSATPQKSGDGPTLYARAGALPSKALHDAKAGDEYVNQLVLPVLPKGDGKQTTKYTPWAWYVAVSGDSKYYIWSGRNCAHNCSNQSHGYCVCSGNECHDLSEFQPVTTTNDSFGRCECTSSKYSNFDCTNSNDSSSGAFKTIYIILIAVGGAIVLAVAIGIPVYCYLQNRKRNNYERV